ncbi:MAG TPA: diguanylate cyclase [Clostridiaceae bacterium]|nr:diguanylate cyclase [Clostridiaceae bacterium]
MSQRKKRIRMLRNIVSLYLFVSIIMILYFSTSIISRSRLRNSRIFTISYLCALLYLFGYLLELNSATLEQAIFWNQVQYFGLPFFPALLFVLALIYTNKITYYNIWKIFIFFIIPFLTFIIRLTNSYHHLYYKSFRIKEILGFNLLILEKGPWYYIYGIYLVFTMIITSFLLYEEYKKNVRYERSKLNILFAASVIPYIGLLIILFDLSEFALDYAAFIMPVSLFLFMYTIFRFYFLDARVMAHDNIFDNGIDAMILLDMEHRVIDYNRAAQNFFTSCNLILRKANIEDIIDNNKELLDFIKGESSREYKLKNGGMTKFFEINSTFLKNTYGKEVGILKSIRDITDKKLIQQKLEVLAIVDELSGLFNRRHFMKLAHNEFIKAKVLNQVFSIIMVDIDRFKNINDSYGHCAGDAVIREFGKIINDNIRKSDIAGRLGGEEFAIIMTNTPIEKARLAAERFREIVESKKIFYEGTYIELTVSIGVASYSNGAKNLEEIMKQADQALYESKANGRNLVTLFRLR